MALHGDSLTRWATNPIVNVSIPVLVIIGGLGVSVLSDLRRNCSWEKLPLHSKLMLSGTLVLQILSTGAFAALEWTNPATLGAPDNAGDRLGAS